MMHFLEGKTLYGRIALSCGQTLWLDPVECRMLLKSDHNSIHDTVLPLCFLSYSRHQFDNSSIQSCARVEKGLLLMNC